MQVLEGSLPSTYAFASVESCEGQKTLRVRMYLDREGQKDGTSARGFKSVMQVLTALQGPSSAWWLLKVATASDFFLSCCLVCPKFLADFYVLIYSHGWQLMNAV
jgi:hypothetical protein